MVNYNACVVPSGGTSTALGVHTNLRKGDSKLVKPNNGQYTMAEQAAHYALKVHDLRGARDAYFSMMQLATESSKLCVRNSAEHVEWNKRERAAEGMWAALDEVCQEMVRVGALHTVAAQPPWKARRSAVSALARASERERECRRAYEGGR